MNFILNIFIVRHSIDLFFPFSEPVGTRTQIREMINSGSVEALEELVLQGHGDRLLGETSGNPIVRDFIRMVPVYMVRIVFHLLIYLFSEMRK